MKFIYTLVPIFTLVLLITPRANGCSATLDACNESCTISAPAGGSANCYTENGTAYCIAYDEDLDEVARETATCGSNGSSGPGGDGNWSDPNCQIYWWTCTNAN